MTTHAEIIALLRKAVKDAGSIHNFEMLNGASNVSSVLNGKRKPSDRLLQALKTKAAPKGYKAVITYVPIK